MFGITLKKNATATAAAKLKIGERLWDSSDDDKPR